MTAMEAKRVIQKFRLDRLKDNPFSRGIYGDTEDVADLVESMGQHGQFVPVVVTPDGEIVSGHRRADAARALGWTEIDCIVFTPKDEAEKNIRTIEENRSRVKTIKQLRQEGAKLKILLGDAATRDRVLYLNRGSEDGAAPVRAEKTQVEVAKKLGISRSLWNQIDYINKYVDIGNETAIEAAALLDAGKISINKARAMIRSAVKALETQEAVPVPEPQKQTAHEYNVACKESISQYIDSICGILEKVEEMPDADFSVMPWRMLASRVRMLNRHFAKLDERVAKKRGRAFENVEKCEEAKDDGEDPCYISAF